MSALGLGSDQSPDCAYAGRRIRARKMLAAGKLRFTRNQAARGGSCGLGVWSAGDGPAGEQIAATSPARNLCGQTTLVDAIDLLALCQQAVSNDSGLLHVAAAVGARVNAIYGSSTPAYTRHSPNGVRCTTSASNAVPVSARVPATAPALPPGDFGRPGTGRAGNAKIGKYSVNALKIH